MEVSWTEREEMLTLAIVSEKELPLYYSACLFVYIIVKQFTFCECIIGCIFYSGKWHTFIVSSLSLRINTQALNARSLRKSKQHGNYIVT